MYQNVTDLSPEQNQAIDLLMAGHTPCNIADQLGVHRQTLWRWRKLPAFQQVQRELLARRRDEMRDEIREIMRLSMVALRRELVDAENPKRYNPIATALNTLRLIQNVPLFVELADAPTPVALEAAEELQN